MEQRRTFLMQRLTLLGYRAHEIRKIVNATVGSKNEADQIVQLERYEQLGSHYIHNFSQ